MTQTPLTAISLFAGIGGFDLGFAGAGIQTVAAVEIDEHARNILARHFPGVPLYEDVRTFGRKQLGRDVDIICGGFPCQDVSIAGKRAGLAGERTGLWWEFVRIIDEFRPRWVIGENVAGLLSSNKGRDFDAIIASLVQRGYGVAWRVFDSQYFGVAQRRRRVFIVASLGDTSASQILFEPEGVRRDTAPVRETSEAYTAYALRRSQTSSKERGVDTEVTRTPCVTDHDAVACIRQRTDEFKEGDVASTIAARDYKGPSDLIVSDLQVRRLTPVECERLQGFPDNWTDGQSDTQRYRQLGNAVTVNVLEWIGRRIASVN